MPDQIAGPHAPSEVVRELLFEDDELGVWRLTVPPGSSVEPPRDDLPKDHWLCVLQGGRALLSAAGASAWEIDYARGQSAFVRHDGTEGRMLTNRGAEPMRLLRVELKR